MAVRKRTWESKGVTQTAWLVDYRDSAGKRRFETHALKRDADARHAEIQNELKQGTHTPIKDSITIREAAEIWFSHWKARKLERGTLRNYRGHLDGWIIPSLGHHRLGKLTTAVVVGFRDELLRKATPARAAKLLSTLKRILAEAQLRGLTAQNVALPVKVAASNRGKKQVTIPSKDDIRLLIENATGRWRPFYVVAVFTGMRASELRGLRWADVDFDKKQVHVRQRVDRWNNAGPPKSRAGQRSIPLSPFVLNALKEWRLASAGNGLLVFPSANGRTPLMHSNICNGSFYPLQRKAGMADEKGYNFHSLRHFAASHWIDLGFAPKKIQSWMGHSSITMTFDVYGHLIPSLEDDHAKLAAGELSIVG